MGARLDRQMIEDLSFKTGSQMDVMEKAYRLIELPSIKEHPGIRWRLRNL